MREFSHTHTNFTVLRVIEADFWSISSMREQVVIGVGMQAYNKVDDITQWLTL